MSIEEMQADLVATTKDVGRLEEVVTNLCWFIDDNGGEDRSSFKLCLMKCEVALKDGRKLQAKITSAIAAKIQERVASAFTAGSEKKAATL